MTDARITRWLKVLMVLVLLFYAAQFVVGFLIRIQAVLYIVIGALFFTYLIYPAVKRLAQRMPLIAAILIVYAIILAALALAGWFIVPRVIQEATTFAKAFPRLEQQFHEFVYGNGASAALPDWLRNEIGHAPEEISGWVRNRGVETVGKALSLLTGVAAAVATFVIIPVLTAYLLLDLENLERTLAAVVPEARWRATLSLLRDVDRVVGGFIRGQLLVALSVGVLITLALLALHVRGPFLLGLIAAVGDLIPYVGAVLAFVPAFLSALIGNGWTGAVFVTVAFVLIYEAEGHLIAPNIVSRQVKLSPFAVMIALLIGAELAGLIGMLIAVPVAGVLRVVALRVFHPPE